MQDHAYQVIELVGSSESSTETRAGPGCLNGFSASISGASAEDRLPSGVASG